MARPTEDSRWATGSGASVTEPSAGKKDAGFLNREAPPAGWLNWLLWLLFQWLGYFDDMVTGFLTTAGLPVANVGDSDTQIYDLSRYLRMGLALGTWQEVEAAQTFHGVAFCGAGNTRVVAVGSGGAIYYAHANDEFATWTQGTGTAAEQFKSIAHSAGPGGGSDMCAVGASGAVYTSVDNGASWTVQSFAGATFSANRVCWCEELSLYIAVGNSGRCQTSPDGATWTERTVSTFEDLHSVAWNGSEAVIVGEAGVSFYSADALSWTAATVVTGTPILKDVAWAGTQWIAVGHGANILARAQGGAAWVARTPDTISVPDYYAVVRVTHGVIVLGEDGDVQMSYVGDVWHSQRWTNSNDDFLAAAWNGGRMVSVGGNGGANTRVSLGFR